MQDSRQPRVALRVTGEEERARARQAIEAASLEVVAFDDAPDVVVVVPDPGERQVKLAERAVVMIVKEVDRRLVTALLTAGIDGIVLEDAIDAQLATVVRAVALGYTVVPRGGRDALKQPVLTARQQQILGLLVLGLSNREIADRLYLSENTVKTHLNGLFNVLGVRSRKDAVDLVLDPASGLGSGVLGIRGSTRRSRAYGAPSVSS